MQSSLHVFNLVDRLLRFCGMYNVSINSVFEVWPNSWGLYLKDL
ncbi:MAG: hypothetical protein OXE41_03815 [Gammaproteobacteria bacterium]|nr:hypothetical protein [Gammaproteobacteria bacterium]